MGNIIKSSTSKASKAESPINIPEEIIVEILSRLPLGSLPRFTCVTKQWSSLISNIIAAKAKTGSTRVLLISDSRAYSFSPHSIDQNQRHEVDMNSIHVPWKLSESVDHEFKILGSCNGLVLMHIDDDLFLWNPLTRFFKKVLASDRVCDRWEDHRVCSGLCYDSTSDEYKAVLVNSSLTPGYGDESVAVGSFRSKSWTTILFPYYYVPLWDSWNVIVNGNLHWFASKRDSGGHFLSPHQIIYFDAHMDKFEEVPMPEHRGVDGDIICGLGVLDGNLCMSRLDSPRNSESNVEVLVMKEYAVAKSWTILLVVSDLDGLNFNFHELAPLSYTKNGEVLTRVSTWKYVKFDRHIRAFNPIDNSHCKISIPDDPSFYIITYEESLITPTDYGWEEEDLKGEATYAVHSYTGDSWNMKKRNYGHYWPTTCINSAIEAESGEKQWSNMDGLPNSKYCESDLEERVQISSSCFTSSHTQGSVSSSNLAFHLMLVLICLMVGAWLWC